MKNYIYLVYLSICLLWITEGRSQRMWTGHFTTFAGPLPYVVEECADSTMNDTTWTKFLQFYDYPDTLVQRHIVWVTEIDGQIIGQSIDIEPSRFLLYDYSLELNDTFYSEVGFFTANMVVTQTDMINILGVARKRIKLAHVSQSYEDEWIEGIGSIKNNYFNPCQTSIPDHGSILTCFKDSPTSSIYFAIDSNACFIDDVEPVCNIAAATIQLQAGRETIAFPNPSRGGLYIRHFQPINRFSIYTMEGILMSHGVSLNQHELDLSNVGQGLNAGMYIILIEGKTSKDSVLFVRL